MDILALIKQLTDSDRWPGVQNPNQLNTLDELAQEAFERNTFDGTLASVLITHQICDELIKHLIAQARFAMRLAMAMSSFDIRFSRKDDDSDLEGLMTGQLISKLEISLEFEEKEEFLVLCREMSDIRNKFAHQLTMHVDLGRIRTTASKYREKFARAETLYEEAADIFQLYFKDHRKDDSWDHMLQEMLEEGLEPEYEKECLRIVELRRQAGFEVDV